MRLIRRCAYHEETWCYPEIAIVGDDDEVCEDTLYTGQGECVDEDFLDNDDEREVSVDDLTDEEVKGVVEGYSLMFLGKDESEKVKQMTVPEMREFLRVAMPRRGIKQ